MKNNYIDKIQVLPLTRPCDIYDGIAKQHYIPKIIVDMPLLSRLSERVPPGYYRLGLIHIASEAVKKPQKHSFVRPPYDPQREGELYVAAIDEEKRRYWVLAQVILSMNAYTQIGEIPLPSKPKNLEKLLMQL